MSPDELVGRVFDYELHRAGWATATFRLGAEPVAVPVSYLHDSLRELARALLGLAVGPAEIGVSFFEEPGTVVLVMRRPDEDAVDLELLRYQGWVSHWPPRGDGHAESLGSVRCRWRTLRGGVVSVLQELLNVHGTDGYLSLWTTHPFPLDELRALETQGR